ncbi:MAG: hypothetical protein IJQ11_00075 [Bacteroidales bacterium]|nr:hypothetical protein [Bacteroidales bacterium]
MKKSLFIIALACLMTFTACKKDKENQGEAQFTATTEHQGGRTSLNPNNGNITWTSGDQIVIANDNDETAVFSLQSGEGTTEGGFGTSDEFNTVGPFIAAYPSDAMIGNDKVTFNLTATQAIENTETFAIGANPMVACSDDKNLSFKNLCGGLGIRLKGVGAHVSAVRITSKNTTEKLWGTFEVTNCAANEPTLTEASGNQGSNVITLTCDVTLTTAAKTFFVMLPPGTLANGFTMEVLDGNEVLATKETTSDIAFVERNNVKCFNEILIDVEFDGNVEIPAGVSSSDIIVTNFSEEAIPDENGDFAIGYSKILTATNAENGQIIYISNLSADYDIAKGDRQQNYELSAKETALHYALCLIPYGLFQSKDATFNSMKDALYELPCVKNLETAIENTVNQYGYLKTDEIGTEIAALWAYLRDDLLDQFFENGKSASGQGPIIVNKIELKRDGTVVSSIPHLPISRHCGVRLDINKNMTYFNESTNTWTVSMTGYNDNGVFLGVTKGTINANGHATPSPERIRYFLPPMNVGKFMGTFTSYSGIRAYFQDTWRLISEPDFGFDDMTWDKAKLDGITLELGQDDNAIVLTAPIDNRETAVMNVVYASLQVVGIGLDHFLGQEGIEAFFTSLLSDAVFVSSIDENFGGGLRNFAAITLDVLERFADFLLVEWVHTLDGMDLDKALNYISSPTARALLEMAGNDLGMLASWYLVEGFAFEVEKESSVVTTQSCEVLSTTQAVVVADLVKPNHVEEFGVCYSTSSFPTIYDICVPLPSPYMAGCYQFQLEGLQPNTFYYARAYAKLYLDMLSYGDVVSFDTYNQPSVTTHEVQQSNIGSTSATVTGSIVFLEPNQLAEFEHGFVLGDSPYGLTVIGENQVEVYNGSELLNYSFTFTDLWPNTTYYFRAYSYSPRGDVVYGDVEHFKTLQSGGSGSYNGHDYVDLGLPSGLLWATCNVGAETPEEYGNYFAWGETQPKSTYNWSTYKYSYDYYDMSLTKYCHNSSYGWDGFTDNLTTLLPEDDAATANWGNGWRMPTLSEMLELFDNTSHTLTNQNGVNGLLFTASNGNILFLPAAGCRHDGSFYDVENSGYYWSSSLSSDNPNGAYRLYFNSFDSFDYDMSDYYRDYGRSVRPVRSARQN